MNEFSEMLQTEMTRDLLRFCLRGVLATLHAANIITLLSATNHQRAFQEATVGCANPREAAEAFVRAINKAMPISLERE